MTRAALRHVPMTMDQVQLTLTGEGGQSVTVRVEGSYLRAKCWGMLADLDPAGLVDAALGQRRPMLTEEIIGLAKTSRILLALRSGPMTNQGLRMTLGDPSITSGNLSHRAQDLIRQGFVYRSDRNACGPGKKAAYALTAKGRARADEIDPNGAEKPT